MTKQAPKDEQLNVQHGEEIVSRHFLRRTARKKRTALIRRSKPFFRYRVRSAARGPFGWYVVEYEVEPPKPKQPKPRPRRIK